MPQRNEEKTPPSSHSHDNLDHTVSNDSTGHVKEELTAEKMREMILQDYIQYRQEKSKLQSVIDVTWYSETSV